MAELVLKAGPETYKRLAEKGGRMDLRALGHHAVFEGDHITFQLVNPESGEPTGPTHPRTVVKATEWFPCAYNRPEDMLHANLIGYEQKKIYPVDVEAAAAVLGAGGMTFSVMSTPDRHWDLRPSRPEIAALKPGDTVAYKFENRENGDVHFIGRFVKHNDLYLFDSLYKEQAKAVLAKGLLVIGLNRLEERV